MLNFSISDDFKIEGLSDGTLSVKTKYIDIDLSTEFNTYEQIFEEIKEEQPEACKGNEKEVIDHYSNLIKLKEMIDSKLEEAIIRAKQISVWVQSPEYKESAKHADRYEFPEINFSDEAWETVMKRNGLEFE